MADRIRLDGTGRRRQPGAGPASSGAATIRLLAERGAPHCRGRPGRQEDLKNRDHRICRPRRAGARGRSRRHPGRRSRRICPRRGSTSSATIDVFYNNAGHRGATSSPITEYSAGEFFRRVLDVKRRRRVPGHEARAAGDCSKRTRAASSTPASIAGPVGIASRSRVYSASKAPRVIGLTKNPRRGSAPGTGVRVNCVCPGPDRQPHALHHHPGAAVPATRHRPRNKLVERISRAPPWTGIRESPRSWRSWPRMKRATSRARLPTPSMAGGPRLSIVIPGWSKDQTRNLEISPMRNCANRN